jgi:hypothetical protein
MTQKRPVFFGPRFDFRKIIPILPPYIVEAVPKSDILEQPHLAIPNPCKGRGQHRVRIYKGIDLGFALIENQQAAAEREPEARATSFTIF